MPSVEYIDKYADGSIPDDAPFIGLLFAGSDQAGIICKEKYIRQAGYMPLRHTAEVVAGDTVRGCSFWCNYTTSVIDESAEVLVGYGDFQARFTDQYIVQNNGSIKGGWSGSGWFKV